MPAFLTMKCCAHVQAGAGDCVGDKLGNWLSSRCCIMMDMKFNIKTVRLVIERCAYVQAGVGDGVGDRGEADGAAASRDSAACGSRTGSLPHPVAGGWVLPWRPPPWQPPQGGSSSSAHNPMPSLPLFSRLHAKAPAPHLCPVSWYLPETRHYPVPKWSD